MEKKIKRILAENLGVSEDEVLAHRSLSTDLGMDDLDRTEIVMALEEEFSIDIPDEDAEKWETVGNVLDCITKAVQK